MYRRDEQKTRREGNSKSQTQALVFLKKPFRSFLINSAKRTARQPESMAVLALDFTSYTSSPNCSGVPSTWKLSWITDPFLRFGSQHDGGKFKKWSKSVRRRPDLVGA